MPSRRRRERYCTPWPQLKLPNEGIFTKDGHLFHHETPRPLKELHRQRLLECGIHLDDGDSFSPDEDERIRKNWRSFAQTHSSLFDDARYLVGPTSSLKSVTFQRLQKKALTKIGMWPQLCRKMDNRSAYQIHQRIHYIFNHSDRADPLPKDVGPCINDVLVMSSGEGSSATHASSALCRRAKRGTRNHLAKHHYRRLFETVVTKSSLCHTVVAKCLLSSPLQLKSHLSNFNWAELVPMFRPLHSGDIKHEWRTIIKQLRASLLAHIGSVGEDQAWARAMDEVMPRTHFSLRDIVCYAKSLRKCIDSYTTDVHSQYIDKIKLARKLSIHGITDSERFNLNTCPVFRRIQTFFRTRGSLIFRHLSFPISAREKLRILEECYRRLESPLHERFSMRSFPKVTLRILVDCVIDRMQHIDPNWQPPAIFQRWIRSWSHVSMYSKCSSNSETNAAIGSNQRWQSFYEDPEKCLLGPETSTGELRWQGSEQEPIFYRPGECRNQDVDSESCGRQYSSVSDLLTQEVYPISKAESAADISKRTATVDDNSGGSKRSCRWTELYNEECGTAQQNMERRFDIFADMVEKATPSEEIHLNEDTTSISNHVYRETEQPNGMLFPEFSTEEPLFPHEDESVSFDNLKISVPSQLAFTDTRNVDRENSFVQDDWMKFLA